MQGGGGDLITYIITYFYWNDFKTHK